MREKTAAGWVTAVFSGNVCLLDIEKEGTIYPKYELKAI